MNSGRTAGATSVDELEFLQFRVSRFGLMVGLFFGAFWLFRLCTILFVDATGTPWASGFLDPSMINHGLASLAFLAVWIVVRAVPLRSAAIRSIEACGLLAGALFIALMGRGLPLAARPDFILLLALSSALTVRAVYVPSTARRSLWLGVAVAAINLVIVYDLWLDIDIQAWAHVQPEMIQYTPRSAATYNLVSNIPWWTLSVAVSVVATRTIYGLRKDVRAAKQLGQYTLEGKLGEGGMGVVFKARHALIHRPTAVKLLLPDKAGERSIERFEREVRLMARLRHPNTITVFDYGRSPDGVFYYAMEYIDGATLETVVSETGPLEPARAVKVVAQAAAAMVEAHGIGLIHRDIKPANVMLFLPHQHGGVEESAKVLDFGLVKDVGATAETLTQADTLKGTPQYMAPESIRDPNKVDARSDLYSLGCLLFFALTGEHVFTGTSVVDILSKHMRDPPDSLSDRLGRVVDPQLEEIVADCLAKEPDARPQSALELERRLRACDFGTFDENDAAEWWAEYGALLERSHDGEKAALTIDIDRARTPSGSG